MEVQIVSVNITPEIFYETFIKKRIPAVFHSHIVDLDWKGNNWTLDYLDKVAGDKIVQIERREGKGFGKGLQTESTISDFIQKLKNGDETHYLTTQELNYSIDDRPELVSEPLSSLINEFPSRPLIMGNLIPQNVNLWIGASKSPSSSGLHHDYHDNLYILLRGTKTFILYPPDEAVNLYTNGQVAKIHLNGRINYVGQIPTKPDGSSLLSESALKASHQIDDIAARLEFLQKKSIESTIMNKTEDEEDIEEKLEEALENLLDAEIAADDFDYTNSVDDSHGNDNDSDSDSDDQCSSTKSEMNDVTSNSYKRRRVVLDNAISVPLNFSRVRSDELTESQLVSQFPLFLRANKRAYKVTIKEGQMLYLPAGWFHEVLSCGYDDNNDDDSSNNVTDPPNLHMAFNYWFHPPDVDGNVSFQHPYQSRFWEIDWESRKHKLIS